MTIEPRTRPAILFLEALSFVGAVLAHSPWLAATALAAIAVVACVFRPHNSADAPENNVRGQQDPTP